ncbi:unnamed protein product [Arabidopsis lyrata]|uniref:Uncharacterized protein n=1 Tax=Arabidopsis lyrata subsp. lyrata TaxID=81972 RepID=D7KB39_ARALL|nr:hypothetical protein ARALYDRAFT_892841 [Arabidopsis lyrata subsp. lyrata]CAH8256678.1 unnamed protein product [Arabidopsis lyrata]
MHAETTLLCRCIVNNNLVDCIDMKISISRVFKFRMEHVFIFHFSLPFIDPFKVRRKIVHEFSSSFNAFDIIECGVQILMDETDGSNNLESMVFNEASESEEEDIANDGDYVSVSRKHPRTMIFTNLKWGMQRQHL